MLFKLIKILVRKESFFHLVNYTLNIFVKGCLLINEAMTQLG